LRLSGIGVAAVVALAVFVALALAGSGVPQVMGFAGAILVAVALVGGVPVAGASRGQGLTSTTRGRTIAHAEPEVLDEMPVDEEAWQRERERRDGARPAQAARGAGAAEKPYDPFQADRRG
jgi:apolipoprotein N-acyltransferase